SVLGFGASRSPPSSRSGCSPKPTVVHTYTESPVHANGGTSIGLTRGEPADARAEPPVWAPSSYRPRAGREPHNGGVRGRRGEGVRGPRAGGWPLLSVGRGPGRVRPEDPPWWLARWWLRGLTGQGVVSVAVGSGGSPVWAGNPSMRAGGCWMRLSRFL